VGAFDMSLMSKFLVQGPHAAAVLDRLSANAVIGPIGQVTYTQWCNANGGIEADLTVTRLEEEQFLVIVSDVCHRRVERMLRDQCLPTEQVTVTDMTAAWCLLSVQGPRSRASYCSGSAPMTCPRRRSATSAPARSRWATAGCEPCA
jgi:4-methylaminobutanoate oxidase (formaldehyde-forming)